MKIETSHHLQIRVLIGVVVFLLAVLSNNIFQLRTLNASEKNHQLLGEVGQLTALSYGIIRSSKVYNANATRDYESYNRDVQVFLKRLLLDMDHFTETLESLSERKINEAQDIVPSVLQALLGQKIGKPQLKIAIVTTARQWERYYAGFKQKLGENKDEPRIEWGVEHLLTHGPEIKKAVSKLETTYENYLNEQAALATKMSQIGMFIIALLGLFGLIWFHYKITKRIGQTAQACARVANGDFGYTLPLKGNDELTVLSSSFNLLSSRSEMVLSLLSQLQTAKNESEALNIIARTSGNYLPIAWCATASFLDNSDIQIRTALPHTTLVSVEAVISNLNHLGKLIQPSLVQGKGIILSNLQTMAAEHPKDPHLNAMAKLIKLQSVLCLPMNTSNWQGILFLGTRSSTYQKHHKEFMEVLSPLMANSFSKL